MRKLALCCILISLIACGATGPIFTLVQPLPENKAVVYIYRPPLVFNSLGWPNLYVNDVKKAALKNGSYIVLFLESGQYRIKSKGSMLFTNWYPEPIEKTFSFESGKEYFIRVTPHMESSYPIITGSTEMALVEKKDAESEIQDTVNITKP